MKLSPWVLKWLEEHLPEHFTGQISINAFKGGVSNVNIGMSIKADDLPHEKSLRLVGKH